MNLRRAAIVSPVRTPVALFGGALRSVPVETLGSVVLEAVIARSKIDPARIEDVVFAQSYASSETPCVGRWIALAAGLPIEVPGMQLDRRCGGGLQSIATAASPSAVFERIGKKATRKAQTSTAVCGSR